MKLNNDYQLVYEGESDTGEVAKRNIRDYFVIIAELPDSWQKTIHSINDDALVFSMLRSHDYMYSANYVRAVQKVNERLAQHRAELSQDTELLSRVQNALRDDHLATCRVDADTSFPSFQKEVHRLVDHDKSETAIYRLINRYGLSRVDRYLADDHIERGDHLIYTYRGLYGDSFSYNINYFDIEDAMFRGEFGYFAPMPSLDAKNQAKNGAQRKIVHLWNHGEQDRAYDYLEKTYGDDFEDALEDSESVDKEGLIDLIQDTVYDQIRDIDIDTVLDSKVVALVDKAKQVAQDGTALWSITDGLDKACPLDDHDVLDIVQEIDDSAQD